MWCFVAFGLCGRRVVSWLWFDAWFGFWMCRGCCALMVVCSSWMRSMTFKFRVLCSAVQNVFWLLL